MTINTSNKAQSSIYIRDKYGGGGGGGGSSYNNKRNNFNSRSVNVNKDKVHKNIHFKFFKNKLSDYNFLTYNKNGSSNLLFRIKD